MKKTIFLFAILFNCTFLTAQIMEIDALKFIQSDINGTARYTGMAGAFGALGGDVSAIKDNPAGLGVYRSSDITITMNIMTQNTKAIWDGKNGNDRYYNTKLDNFAYVIALPTWAQQNGFNSGLLYSNFSFSYNRLKNFNRNMLINGGRFNVSMSDYMADLVYFAEEHTGMFFGPDDMRYSNEDIAWLSVLGYNAFLINETADGWQPELRDGERTIPTYTLEERGFVNEYALAWSGNFSNRLYVGAGLNLQAIDYSIYSTYNEDFVGSTGHYFELRNNFSASGVGYNMKIGAIYQPADFVRLGFAFQTPTRFVMSDVYNPAIIYKLYSSALNDKNVEYGLVSGSTSPDMSGTSDYKIKNPMRLNVSAAFFLGKKGLLSTEYVYNAYGNTMFYDTKNSIRDFENQNDNMKNVLQDAHTIKIGVEFRATDNVSLRTGFATATAATKQDAIKQMFSNTMRTDTEFFRHIGTNYFTAGLGYREKHWYLDVAYMHKQHNESFMPYEDIRNVLPAAKVTTSNNNIVATFGFRF